MAFNSRWCSRCEIGWPTHADYVKCPMCEYQTSSHDDLADFDVEEAKAYMVDWVVKQSREAKIAEFDRLIDERDMDRQIELINSTLVVAVLPPDRDEYLAAQFAKLREHPTKEVTDG